MKTRLVFLAAIIFGLAPAVLCQVTQGSKQIDVKVVGLDAKELRLSVDELDKLPQVNTVVKNEDDSTTTYSGVRLQVILDKLKDPSKNPSRSDTLQQLVIASARDKYSAFFSMGELDQEFGDLKIFLVYRKDGKALPDYQGPFRLLIPSDKAGARSIRMLETIRVIPFTAKDGK